jgi:hypothetical protein
MKLVISQLQQALHYTRKASREESRIICPAERLFQADALPARSSLAAPAAQRKIQAS